jgi:hypothetical protein
MALCCYQVVIERYIGVYNLNGKVCLAYVSLTPYLWSI